MKKIQKGIEPATSAQQANAQAAAEPPATDPISLSRSWFTMKSTGEKSAEISIYDEIGVWGVGSKQFKDQLDGLGEVSDLQISINSPGGDVFEGNAIYNMLISHAAKKTVTIDGWAASMASIVAMAGDKIRMPENAVMMIHNPFVMTIGDGNQLRKDAALLDNLKANAIKAYRRHARDLTEQDISAMMDAETWLFADDAVSKGFADEVVPQADIKAMSTRGLMVPQMVARKMFGGGAQAGAAAPVLPEPPVVQAPAPRVDNSHSTEGKAMLCLKCKKELSDGSTFCNHCGAPQNLADASARERAEIEEAARKAEMERVTSIMALAVKAGVSDEIRNKAITNNQTPEQFAKDVLLSAPQAVKPTITATADEAEKRHAVMVAGMMVGAGKATKEDREMVAKSEVKATSIHSLIREAMIADGASPRSVASLNPEQLYAAAIRMARRAQMAGVSTGDLTSVLADVQNKMVSAGFESAPSTYQAWVDEMDVKDFKSIKFPKLSMVQKLKTMPEGAPFERTKLSDKQETGSLDTYGIALPLTRQAIINDDMGLMVGIPTALGQSARRTLNEAVYDLLTTATGVGPTMTEDSVALFDASSHGNLISTSGVLSNASVAKAMSALRKTRGIKTTADESAGVLNLQGRYIIAGTQQNLLLYQLTQSPSDPTVQVNGSVPNFVRSQGLIGVEDGYLQTVLELSTGINKANAFYVSADKPYCPIVVCYLNGMRTPTVRSAASQVGDSLGIIYDVMWDFEVAARDWRGIVYNDGAAS